MKEIVLDGPAKNAMGSEMMKWLRQQLREADGAPFVLRGENGALSAGLNVKEVASLEAADMTSFIDLLEGLVDDLYHYPGPTVACIDGHAIAGGCVLALACDHRIAADNPKIRIGLNEVALGLRFPPKVLALARAVLGQRASEWATLGAGLHDSKRALEAGLVDEVVSDALAASHGRLEALAAHPAHAYRVAKHELRKGNLDISERWRARFNEEDLPTWTSPELKAKLNAMLGKSK